jgi:hypothetical protein
MRPPMAATRPPHHVDDCVHNGDACIDAKALGRCECRAGLRQLHRGLQRHRERVVDASLDANLQGWFRGAPGHGPAWQWRERISGGAAPVSLAAGVRARLRTHMGPPAWPRIGRSCGDSSPPAAKTKMRLTRPMRFNLGNRRKILAQRGAMVRNTSQRDTSAAHHRGDSYHGQMHPRKALAEAAPRPASGSAEQRAPVRPLPPPTRASART